MKIIHAFLCLFTLLAGLMAGKWISGEAVARVEAERAWKQQDVEGCFKALKRVAQSSPTHAFELLLTLEKDESPGKDLLSRLTKEFPEAGTDLMTVFLQHPEHYRDYSTGYIVFSSCARADPERAWQVMQAHAMYFNPAFLPAIARGMAQRDPLAALPYAQKIHNPMQSESFVHEVIQEWSERDGQGLLNWLRAQPDARTLARHVGWFQLKINDPALLTDIAALLPEGVPMPFSHWTSRAEAEGAWMQHTDWLLALPAGETRERLCTVAALGLANLDPEAALKFLPEIKDATVHRRVTSTVSAYRAAVAPQEGLAFANTLTEPEERRLAKNSVFFTWAENDPPSAAHHALESGDPDARIMLSSATSHWARSDPENVCRFALENEPPSDSKRGRKSTMLYSAVSAWAGVEPVAAARWVKTLPEGEPKDAAVAAVASALAYRLPEEGLLWAQDIKDAQRRRQTLSLCFQSWLRKDADKPKQWLQQASLDKESRESLEANLKYSAEAHQSGQSNGGENYLSDGIMIFR
jgi:hypothetical protein